MAIERLTLFNRKEIHSFWEFTSMVIDCMAFITIATATTDTPDESINRYSFWNRKYLIHSTENHKNENYSIFDRMNTNHYKCNIVQSWKYQ